LEKAPLTTAPVEKYSGTAAAERRAIGALRLLAALSLLFPAIIFVIAASLSYRDHFSDAHARLARAADLIHEHALKVFDSLGLTAAEIDEIVRDMSDDDIRKNEVALRDRFLGLEQALPDVRNITIFNSEGLPLVSALSYPASSLPIAPDRSYFREERPANSRPFVSALLSGRSSDQQFFVLSIRRSSPDGSFRGIISVAADQKYFQDFYQTVAGEDFSSVGLLRSDGSILAHYPPLPPALEQPGSARGLAVAIEQDPRSGEYVSTSPGDEIPRLFAYRRLEDMPVYVSVAVNISAIRHAWLKAMTQQLYFGLPATIGLFLLSLRALRHAREQYKALATLRGEIERREFAEGALRQASKMEAIGRLTGGVAHDFNNLLQIMVGRLGRIDRAVESGKSIASRDLEGMHFAIDRAATLTHRLLAFSRQQPLKVEVVDLDKLVGGMGELIRQTVGESVSVETMFASGLWKVMVDANQLENALLNIASNARDAINGRGKLIIETANVYLDEDYVNRYADIVAGQYAMISISDTGTGIPQDIIAKVFDPFFTTKAAGQGTGLGLSMVYGFVRQSGGHVSIYSEIDRGTTIKIYLPRHHQDAEQSAIEAPRRVPEATGRGEKILVVEDEEEVRTVVVETLRDMGYNVIAAGDGRAALVLFAETADISLLLTDVGLPEGMNGRQLADELLRRSPDLPILFMTGYARDAIVHHGRVDPGVQLLPKPFTREALSRKVREMLTRSEVA
jgi:signal transduction histidine kinase/CheY-like chemotaxis protein